MSTEKETVVIDESQFDAAGPFTFLLSAMKEDALRRQGKEVLIKERPTIQLAGDDVCGVRSSPITQEDVDALAGLGNRLVKLGAQLTQINSEVSTALNAIRKQQMELMTKLAKANLR